MAARTHLYVFITLCALGTQINGLLETQASVSQERTVVFPKRLHERPRRQASGKPSAQDVHVERLTYSLRIGDRDRTLHLELNRHFLSPDYVESHGHRGTQLRSTPTNHVHCHYHGYVEGDADSMVALSTCEGLSGVIHVDALSYGVEPVPESVSGEHHLYSLDWNHQAGSEPFVCGVTHTHTSNRSEHHTHDDHTSLTELLRRKRNLPQTRFVELVLVVDKQRFDFKKQNMTAVREEAVQLANLLDGYYKRLNVRIVLVGLVVFEDQNPFDVDGGSAGDVLGRFVTWRRKVLLPQKRHDVGQLLVGRSGAYPGGVLGMAFVSTVCSVHNAGGINVFSGTSVPGFSTVLAHELGHNLGMGHDSTGCTCDGKTSCIMAPTAGGAAIFSDCSGKDFERLVLGGGGACLMNQPPPSDVVTVAVCGNGVLEKGEQCDCGTPEECNSRCCDAATCRLTSGSACAEGECCQDCQFRVAGSQCRGSQNQCDLPEFCNGSYAFCPGDFYMMDGLSCSGGQAFCYEGRCQTYDYQCKHLFGPTATKADDRCFSHVNTKGNEFGNCGYSGSTAIPCATENVMCGKIQCTNFDTNDPPQGVTISIENIGGAVCKNAHYNLGPDVLDPAYVNQGSVCASGKACLNFKCVNDSALIEDTSCTAKETCHGNGVCNNEGNCHCNNGWAPPRCDRGGRGGSVDSGPAQIDHSLRNGLLIFFLLVVPLLVLLILVLLYVYKPHTLEPCMRRSKPHRSRNTTTQANGNPQRSTSPQPPQQLPPTNPQPFHPNLSEAAVSYDPWQSSDEKTESAAAAYPPPRQGPGAPRPIPPKHT